MCGGCRAAAQPAALGTWMCYRDFISFLLLLLFLHHIRFPIRSKAHIRWPMDMYGGRRGLNSTFDPILDSCPHPPRIGHDYGTKSDRGKTERRQQHKNNNNAIDSRWHHDHQKSHPPTTARISVCLLVLLLNHHHRHILLNRFDEKVCRGFSTVYLESQSRIASRKYL